MTRQQRWALQNPDKRRAICRNYRQRNPEDRERKNARNRRYYWRKTMKTSPPPPLLAPRICLNRECRVSFTPRRADQECCCGYCRRQHDHALTAARRKEERKAASAAKVPPSIQQLRRAVGYTPEKEREMSEQAQALHQWSKSGVRSSKRLREMQI